MLGATADERPFAGWRDLWLLVLFGIGSVVMRGAGCTYQRHRRPRHRRPGGAHARTADPVRRGERAATRGCSWSRNASSALLSCCSSTCFAIELGAASLLLVAAYPFMKRITWWPQAWLGLTFNWGALLGFAAADRA